MVRALLLALSLSLAAPLARAADPDRPHPHKGVITAYKGAPPVPELSEQDLATLDKGKPVLKQEKDKGGTGGRGIAVQDIHASTETVWSKIIDYPKYPEMVDNVKETENYEVEGDTIKTRFVIGAMLMNIEYFIVHTYRPEAGYLTWTLDYSRDSDLDDSVGFWRVQSIPDKPGWTRVFYSVQVKLKGWVPAMVEDMVAKQGLTKATEWVKRESEAATSKPTP